MEPRNSGASGTQYDDTKDEPGSGQSKFAAAKEVVADKLRSAADAIAEKTGPSAEAGSLAGYGQQAAEWLNHSADYVSQLDLGRVKTDFEKKVRMNPGQSLLIAGATGLLVGVWLRRR